MSEGGDKIIKALDEVLAWSRGEGTLPVWFPDGTKVDVTVEEYEFFRLGEPSEALENRKAGLADAHSNPNPNRSE